MTTINMKNVCDIKSYNFSNHDIAIIQYLFFVVHQIQSTSYEVTVWIAYDIL
jgi:hypothetical protein